MKTSRAEQPDKRDAVLAAALSLFAEKGFHGTTMPEIATRARVGAGTIYRYFPSKEALVNALFQHWKLALASRLTSDLPDDAKLRDVFHQLWFRLAQFAEEEPDAYAFLELHHHAPYLDKKSVAIEAELLSGMGLLIHSGTQQKILKPLPAECLFALAWGAVNGLLRAAALGYLKLTPTLLAQAEACAWEAIAR